MWQHLRGSMCPSAILLGPAIPRILEFGVSHPLASVTSTLQVTPPTVLCSVLHCVLYINGIVTDVFFGTCFSHRELCSRDSPINAWGPSFINSHCCVLTGIWDASVFAVLNIIAANAPVSSSRPRAQPILPNECLPGNEIAESQAVHVLPLLGVAGLLPGGFAALTHTSLG